jgi:hypothetical protein
VRLSTQQPKMDPADAGQRGCQSAHKMSRAAQARLLGALDPPLRRAPRGGRPTTSGGSRASLSAWRPHGGVCPLRRRGAAPLRLQSLPPLPLTIPLPRHSQQHQWKWRSILDVSVGVSWRDRAVILLLSLRGAMLYCRSSFRGSAGRLTMRRL